MKLIISLFIFSSMLLIGMMQLQTQIYNWKESQSLSNNNSYMNGLNERSDSINYGSPFIINNAGWMAIGIHSNFFKGTFNYESISGLYKKSEDVTLFSSSDSSKTDSINSRTGVYRSGKWGAESYVFRGAVNDF